MKCLIHQILPAILPGGSALSANCVLLLVVALVFASGGESKAQVVTLTDNNSVAFIDTSDPNGSGMFYWGVQGWNQLQQQGFWYGIGNGPVAPINAISAPTITSNSPREASISYGIPGAYNVSVHYFLTGGQVVPIGPAFGDTNSVSEMDETVTIVNLSGAALPFHLYQYADFGVFGGREDSVRLVKGLGGGLYNEADQIDLGGDYSKAFTTNGANHAEAALFPTTLAKLNGGGPVTLNDIAGPLGPGDATWALEWDLNIAPGNSAAISVDEFVNNLRNVPEPSATTLAGLGVAGWMFLRRPMRR